MKKQEREEKRRKELIAKKRVEYYKPIDNAEL